MSSTGKGAAASGAPVSMEEARRVAAPALDAELAAVGSDEAELSKEDTAVINTVVNTLGPLAMRFGWGGLVGFCSGYAVKKAAKVAAVVVGMGFMFLQGLQYVGYIEVKYGKIKEDITRRLDSDGSGQLGIKDLRYYVTRFFKVLRTGAPAAGFSTGLYLGFVQG